MAASYALATAPYGGRYLRLTCTQTKNVATNKNTINWTLSSIGESGTNISTGPTTVTIAGKTVVSLDRVTWDTGAFPAATGSISGSLTVDAAKDGSCSVAVSISTAIYVYAVSTVSGRWYLDDIPRAATLKSAPNFSDEQNPTITYNNPAGSAAVIQASIYDTTGGIAYARYRNISSTGTSYTFELTDEERQALMDAVPSGADTMSVKFYLKTIINGSTVGPLSYLTRTLTVKRPATLTSAPNFSDEDNPTITYNNRAGNTIDDVQVGILADDGATQLVRYRSVPITDTSYTFELTDEERQALIAAIPNGSNNVSVRFYIKTYKDETIVDVPKYLIRTLTIKNAIPELSHTLVDAGAASTQLTNDPNVIIKGFNYVTASMTPTLKKGATINKASITNGEQIVEGVSGIFNNAENNSFIFSITDSFGQTVNKTVNMTMIPYIKLTSYVKANNPTADGDMAFKISGNYFNNKFGDAGVNNALTIKWRIKENNNEYGEWIDVVSIPNIIGNTYDVTVNVTGLNYRSAYTVQAIAYDLVNTSGVLSNEQKVKAIPVYNWGEDNFDINVPLTVDNISSKNIITDDISSKNIITDDVSSKTIDTDDITTDNINAGNIVTDNLIGNNVFSGELELGSWDSNAGVEQENASSYRNINPVEIESGATYEIRINNIPQKMVVLYYDENNSFLSETRNIQSDGIFTVPINAKYINFRCYQADFTEDYSNLDVKILKASPINTKTINGINIIGSGDIKTNPVYEYSLTNHSNVSVNAWNRCCNDITTDILPAGKYLVQTSFSVDGGNTGNNIASLKVMIDGADLPNAQRTTIPIYNGLVSTFNFNGYVEFTSSSTHTVSLRVYTSIALTPMYTNKIRFIKIG